MQVIILVLVLHMIRLLIHRYANTNHDNNNTNDNNNNIQMSLDERLAEYGWKPHRVVVAHIELLLLNRKTFAGLDLLACAWNTEGYGFIGFEISNRTISSRCPQIGATQLDPTRSDYV